MKDRQRAAEQLLDNPRDSHGRLLQNTGRIY